MRVSCYILVLIWQMRLFDLVCVVTSGHHCLLNLTCECSAMALNFLQLCSTDKRSCINCQTAYLYELDRMALRKIDSHHHLWDIGIHHHEWMSKVDRICDEVNINI